MKRIYLILFSVTISSFFLPGCFLVKKIAGADIDAEQFQKAREAKMYEIKSKTSSVLLERLSKPDPISNADITFYLSEEFLNKVARQYNSTNGWLDESTPYTINSVDLKVNYGSAIASMGLKAKSNKYNVLVNLTMDCILNLELKGNELQLQMEPFNIAPAVDAKGLLSSADEIIQNLIKINLANISKSMPPISIPINIANQMAIPGSKTNIKDKVNLLVVNPERIIDYKMKIKEILFLENAAFVALNLEKAEVK